MITIFLLCKYFKPWHIFGTCWHEVCERGKVKLVYEMDKIFLSANTFCNSKRAKIEARILHHCWSLLKIQGTGLCSCGLLYCSTVRLLSRNRISSNGLDIIVFGNHFFWSFLCILLGIRTQTYRNPTYFLFRKVSTQTLATLAPFLPFFSDLLGF